MRNYTIFGVIIGLIMMSSVAYATNATVTSYGDTWVSSYWHTANYGTSAGLQEQKTASYESRIYVQFDMSALTPGGTNLTAKLCLHPYSIAWTHQYDNITYGVYNVLDEFDENNITWDNQPCGTAFNNATACNLTAEMEQKAVYTSIGECFDVSNMANIAYNTTMKLAIAVRPSAYQGAGLTINVYSKEILISDLSKTPPELVIECSLCVPIPSNITTTTAAPYSPEANLEAINGLLTYVGSSLGASSMGLITDVQAGKMIVWAMIMIAVAFAAFYYVKNINAIIVLVLEIVLLMLGVVIGYIPFWVGLIIIVLAFAVVGYAFRSIIFGGGG